MPLDIINTAKIPQSGLVVELSILEAINNISRNRGIFRAAYGGTKTNAKAGMFSVRTGISSAKPFNVNQSINALVLTVSGSPVTLTYETDDLPVSLVVTKVLVLDQPLTKGFTLTTGSESSVVIYYIGE